MMLENIAKSAEKTRGIRRLVDFISDGIFPRPCISCKNEKVGENYYLCSDCLKDIRRIINPFCNLCGNPGDMDYDYPHQEFVCGLCRHQPYRFQKARSFGYYENSLKDLIQHLKYQKQPGVIRQIRPFISEYFENIKLKYGGFTVVPVPLSKERLKDRGFDQAFLIAREVARTLNIPQISNSITRIRDTPYQAGLDRNKRLENIKGAFEVSQPDFLKGKKILLVDDVLTTGSTCNEVTKVLKISKIDCVNVFTLARAVKGRPLQ
ncbi:MAG: ComF family protein [Nitrospinales bacterium]